MSPQFIPYGPDVEIVEPDFDANVQTVIARMERYITDSVTAEGTGQAVRDAHAKGYGLVRGEVEILDGLPDEAGCIQVACWLTEDRSGSSCGVRRAWPMCRA
ncbi:hypothetical protein ABZ468_54395 [Streptomyces sp. NPDC005708]|uniref:hypothetical protein n=1 Tax=Streptomyces sp. NPDC005708 TaxID=3154564 RepID=UPI0033C8CF25